MAVLNKTEQALVERHGALALTMEQLADELQISKRSLYNMIASERCPVKVIGKGKLRRAPIVDVARWINGEL